MKIRTGFVSNSSTSSFLIYGTVLDKEEILNLGKSKIPEAAGKEEEENDYDDVYGVLEELFKDTDLEHFIPYDDEVYVGTTWSAVGDNETGKEFKDRVEGQIAKVFGKELPCDSHSEAWHD